MSEEKINNQTSEASEKSWGWVIFLLAIVFVLLVWGLNWLFAWSFLNKNDERGAFGGMFGAVSALFSGLAFAALIYTIWLQRDELKLQREELKLQRKALELQAEELKRQADELEKTVNLQQESLKLHKKQIDLSEAKDKEEKERILSLDKPDFIQIGQISPFLGHRVRLTLILRNQGADASNVKVSGANLTNPTDYIPVVQGGTNLELTWKFENIEVISEELINTIDYVDKRGRKDSKSFTLRRDKNATNINEMFFINFD